MLEYWREIGASIGFIATFLAGRKSTKISNSGGQIDNLQKFQSMYDTFVTQHKKEYDILSDKVEYLTIDVHNLQTRNQQVISDNQEWKNKFSSLKHLYDTLKFEFETYKKKHKNL